MAKDTPLSYRSLVIYEVYVRNHGPLGKFSEVEADLARIRALGVDVLWFMPIHPIGAVARKGTLGSPYSIADYREVNPEYGTKADFASLIEKAHAIGLKVMIDVVYNHTAHDSNLVADHPDWYHQDVAGKPYTTVPEWSDIIDLNHPNAELDQYLVDTLVGWVKFGVDGFRCDVASLLPEEFWVTARAACAEVNPNTLWLAESVHAGFVGGRRQVGLTAISDSEVYRGFDMTYDYDIFPIWQAAVRGAEPVSRYLEMVRLQECIYPVNYVKMRCAENHDQPRIHLLAPIREQALAWTAFEAFNKGAFLIYDGQEAAARHTPNLFENDKIEWGTYELTSFLTTLAKLKKDPAVTAGVFTISAAEPAIVAEWEAIDACLLGIFNVQSQSGSIVLDLPDGEYEDVLNGGKLTVKEGKADLPVSAAILRYSLPVGMRWFASTLFDFHVDRDSP